MNSVTVHCRQIPLSKSGLSNGFYQHKRQPPGASYLLQPCTAASQLLWTVLPPSLCVWHAHISAQGVNTLWIWHNSCTYKTSILTVDGLQILHALGYCYVGLTLLKRVKKKRFWNCMYKFIAKNKKSGTKFMHLSCAFSTSVKLWVTSGGWQLVSEACFEWSNTQMPVSLMWTLHIKLRLR